MHPETAAGEPITNLGMEFVNDTVKQSGRSQTDVYRDTHRAERIRPEVLAEVTGTELDKGTVLDTRRRRRAWLGRRLSGMVMQRQILPLHSPPTPQPRPAKQLGLSVRTPIALTASLPKSWPRSGISRRRGWPDQSDQYLWSASGRWGSHRKRLSPDRRSQSP
jgi:hypothetical protein